MIQKTCLKPAQSRKVVMLIALATFYSCAAPEPEMESRVDNSKISAKNNANRILNTEDGAPPTLESALIRLLSLEKALSKEAEERKEADQRIEKQVKTLELGLSDLNSHFTSEIGRLDKSLETASASIVELARSVDEKIKMTREETDKKIAESNADQQSKLEARALMLEGSLIQMEDNLNNLREHAERTYATKAEMDSVKAIAQRLQRSINLANKKIGQLEMQDQKLEQLIDQRIKSLSDDFASQISRLDARDAEFQIQLNGVAKEASDQIAREVMRAKAQTEAIISIIGGMQAYNLENHAKLKAQFESLESTVAGVSRLATGTRESLNQKFEQLQHADNSLKLEFQNALLAGLKTEQDAREDLNKQLAAVKKNLEQVAETALAAQHLAEQGVNRAKANEEALKTLSKQVNDLESSFKSDLAGIAKKAEILFSQLDDKYQKEVGQLSVRLTDIEARIGQLTKSLDSFMSDPLKLPQDAILSFVGQTRFQREAVISASVDMAEALAMMDGYFYDVLNIVDNDAAPSPALADSFVKAVVETGVCTGAKGFLPSRSSAVKEQPSVNGHLWYMLLSDYWRREVFFGIREGAPKDEQGLFAGVNRVEARAAGAFVLLALLPDRGVNAEPACQQGINEWAKAALYGSGSAASMSQTVRAKLQSEKLQEFGRSVVSPRLANLMSSAKTYQELLSAFLSLRMASVGVESLLFGGANGDAIRSLAVIPRLGIIFAEIAKLKRESATMEAQFDNMKDVLAKHSEAQKKNQSDVMKLTQAMDDLRSEMRAKNTEQDQKINALALGLQRTLSLVSVLANQLGRADVALAANALTRSIGNSAGSKTPAGKGGLISAMFSFPYVAEGAGGVLSQCSGSIATSTSKLTGGKLPSHCAGLIRRDFDGVMVTVYRNNIPWYVFPGFSASCVAIVQSFGRLGASLAGSICAQAQEGNKNASSANIVSIQGGLLRIEVTSPDEAGAIKRMQVTAAGMSIPTDKLVEPNWTIAVGDPSEATFLKVSPAVPGQPYMLFDLGQFPSSVKEGITYYSVPGSFVFSKTPRGFWSMVSLETLSSTLKSTGSVTYQIDDGNLNIYSYSPIVVNLDGRDTPSLLPWEKGHVLFDLDADGRPERTGWIAHGSYLLALDVDGNNKIDNGRELFGTATILPDGRRAANGYLALAQYDQNKDGIIDARDTVFKKLRLWNDLDRNGVSKRSELHSLSDVHVTGISTGYQIATATKHDNLSPTGNQILYQSKVFGPKPCGHQGCQTFDVWFGTVPLTQAFAQLPAGH